MSDIPDKSADAIREYLFSAKSMSKLAASMAAPLRSRRDYQSVGRKSFLAEPLECPSCKRTDVSVGADAGCPDCVSRHVMET